jgi:RNA polymerase sigma-70 factor (ECF subfamily)
MDSSTQQIEELYRADGPGLLRYIRKCGGGNRSEDLLQETFVRALEKPERVSNARLPRAWLYGVARHVVFDFLRKQSRITELTIDPPAPAKPEEDVRMIQLKSAMAKLPHDQQEALRLRLDAELSYEEIAVALGIPVGTVRSRLHYAVRKLRAAVGGKEMEYE